VPQAPLPEGQPLLPYARSFLVQFTADSDTGLRRAAGRVEHLQTAMKSRFASMGGLRACIAAMLAALATAPDAARGPGSRPTRAPSSRAGGRKRAAP